ncbi:PLDc N-terminal domain-containing protein [Williamsia sp. D3]|uniref:PLDc N-terminal domain-containing protein n=1 Tax=Williamsia sp. D3 TaxID=1313067 RepID=UPI001F2C4D97|nr:PLDc N-terminal domain-containing protein [Williamsia sp. D3]
MIAALVDIIGSEAGVRGLPRWGWLLLVIVLPLVGSIVWFVAGRPVAGGYGRRSGSGRASALGFPEYDEPGRFEPADPAADAEFLRQVRERARSNAARLNSTVDVANRTAEDCGQDRCFHLSPIPRRMTDGHHASVPTMPWVAGLMIGIPARQHPRRTTPETYDTPRPGGR